MPRTPSQALEVRMTQAKQLYIESPATPTLEEVADMYGLSLATVKLRSAEGNWKQERQAFQARLAERNREKHVPVVAEEIARIRTKSFELIETAMDVMQQGLQDGTLRWSNPKQAGETITALLAGLRETGFLGSAPAPEQPGGRPATVTNVIGMVAAMPGVSIRPEPTPTTIDMPKGE